VLKPARVHPAQLVTRQVDGLAASGIRFVTSVRLYDEQVDEDDAFAAFDTVMQYPPIPYCREFQQHLMNELLTEQSIDVDPHRSCRFRARRHSVAAPPVIANAAPYANCSEAKAHGDCNIPSDSPYYQANLDRDQDGLGCEC